MSEILWSFYSNSLGTETSIRIYLPDSFHESTPIKDYRLKEVVIALHGLGGNNRQLSSYLPIEYIATKYNSIIVLPDGNRSFYLDNKSNYQTYICEELINKLTENLNIDSPKINKWNILGISMGGYGALRIASKYPNIFKSVCAISSALDYTLLNTGTKEELFKLNNEDMWPWDTNNSPENFNFNTNTNICILCGTEDPFIKSNKEFLHYLDTKKINYISLFEKGDHSWSYWNVAIQKAFNFIRSFNINELFY